jgi:hypothetical protein
MDLQQKSWLSEVRTVGSGAGVGCDKRLISPEVRDQRQHDALGQRESKVCWPSANANCVLSLRLSARQLLHLRLLRSASVLAGLEWMLGFALLPRGPFYFFAFVLAESRCISHECFLDLSEFVIWKFCTFAI